MTQTVNNETKEKMFFYEKFANEFDAKMNMYDTNKRVDVIFDELLRKDIKGKTMLDAGCGTGWFSKRACEYGAVVTSMDLGENLLACVKQKCESTRVVGSILEMPFESNTFDLVVSSEVIEHTPEPFGGVREIYRVLKPGGEMVLTTPNKFWYWSVWIANKLKLRPYQGLENWTGYWQMKREVKKIGFEIEEIRGIHLFPFVHRWFYPILNFFHKWKFLSPFMVNIAIKCKKPL